MTNEQFRLECEARYWLDQAAQESDGLSIAARLRSTIDSLEKTRGKPQNVLADAIRAEIRKRKEQRAAQHT